MSLDRIIVQYDAEIKELRKEVESLKKSNLEIESSAKKAGKSYTDMQTQVKGQLTSAFKGLGVAIAGAFAIQRIGAFINSTIELAREAEEVRRVFDKLNNPQLLSELRRAVSGTVGDLALMKAAIKAENFKIPLQDLAKLFQFAKIKADETGQSVESLADVIITAVGRNSTRALVELGISQADINAKVKETGSLYQGMVSIIDKAVAEAGPDIDSMADKQDRLRASIENTKIELGEKFLPLIASFLDGLNYTTQQIMELFDKTAKKEEEGSADRVKLYRDHGSEITDVMARNFDKFVKQLGDVSKLSNDEIIKLSNEAKKELERNMPEISSASSDEFKIQAEGMKSAIESITNYTQKILKARESNKAFTDETKEFTDETKEDTKAKVDNVKAINEYVLAIQKLNELFGLPTQSEAVTQLDLAWQDLQRTLASSETPIKTAEVNVDALADALLSTEDATVKAKDGLNELADESEDAAERATLSWQDYAYAIGDIFASIDQAYAQGSDYRMSLLERELEQGIIDQKTYDYKSKQLKEQEAKREKAYTLFSILLSTGRAIMSALGTVPPNPALAILASVTGAVQLGVAAAAPIPAFRKGGEIKGKEQIIRVNEEGTEFIAHAKATRKHKSLLQAINEDRVDKYLVQNFNKILNDDKHVVSDTDYRILLAIKQGNYQARELNSNLVKAINSSRRPHRALA